MCARLWIIFIIKTKAKNLQQKDTKQRTFQIPALTKQIYKRQRKTRDNVIKANFHIEQTFSRKTFRLIISFSVLVISLPIRESRSELNNEVEYFDMGRMSLMIIVNNSRADLKKKNIKRESSDFRARVFFLEKAKNANLHAIRLWLRAEKGKWNERIHFIKNALMFGLYHWSVPKSVAAYSNSMHPSPQQIDLFFSICIFLNSPKLFNKANSVRFDLTAEWMGMCLNELESISRIPNLSRMN